MGAIAAALDRIGVKPAELTRKQATSLGVARQGPFKAHHSAAERLAGTGRTPQ